jgi:hypothetical protein
LSAESLLVTTPGINWYWLEPGIFTSSQNGLRPLNPFFNCSKHRWSMVRRPLFFGNSALYLQFGVPSFILQDSETGCRRMSYGYVSFLLAAPQPELSRPLLSRRFGEPYSHCLSLLEPSAYSTYCTRILSRRVLSVLSPCELYGGCRFASWRSEFFPGFQYSFWASKPSNFPNRFMASCVVLMLQLIKDL